MFPVYGVEHARPGAQRIRAVQPRSMERRLVAYCQRIVCDIVIH